MSKSRLEKFLYALYSLDSSDLPTPLSRIEELYNCWVTGEESPTFKPLSRVEKYLMVILGVYDVDSLPNPISRVEVLLYKLATGDDNLDDIESFLSEHEELLAEIIRNGGVGGNIDIEYVLYTLSTEFNTLYNTAEKPVKSAILKGNTKYRDIDTGDILDTFDETKNLELVSVKMPVLTTTGKNLFDEINGSFKAKNSVSDKTGEITYYPAHNGVFENYIPVKPNTIYTLSGQLISGTNPVFRVGFYQKDKTFTKTNNKYVANNGEGNRTSYTFTTSENEHYIRFSFGLMTQGYFQLEEGTITTKYEPFKSNILTVNEDITLRGVGDVKDELNLITGELTQHIGGIVLDGSEDWQDFIYNQDDDTVAFSLPKTFMHFRDAVEFMICDKYKIYGTTYGCDEECMGINNDEIYHIQLRILKTKASTIEELKTYLSSNPIKLQGVLPTESVKTVDLSVVDQDGNNTKLSTFNNITHVTLSSEGLIPEAELEVATKNEEVLNTMSLEMDDIFTTQTTLGEAVNTQSENVDATMIATTEIYEELL